MRKAVFCFVILAGVILAGCAPDPRNQADADKTRILAQEAAADRAQARNQAAELWRVNLAEQEQKSAARVASSNRVQFVASIAVCVVVSFLAAALSWGLLGAARAVARAAELKASLIPLPESTRQYPLLIQYNGRGRFSLANPNTGAVALLDSANPGDRQMIAVAGSVLLGGIVAHEARRAGDAAAVVQAINPVIVTGEGCNHGRG